MRYPALMVGIVVSMLALMSGCGEATSTEADAPANASPSSTQPTLTTAGVGLLRQHSALIDYIRFETPAEMLAEEPAAFVGTVDAVLPGRSIVTGSGTMRTRDNSMVLRIKASQSIKSAPGTSVDGMIYVSLPRGVNAIDAQGNIPPGDPNPSVDEFRKALPQGLQVVVISRPLDLRLPNPAVQRVDSDPNPPPDGAALLDGMLPQTITFDQGTAKLIEWSDYTFDEFVAEVTK